MCAESPKATIQNSNFRKKVRLEEQKARKGWPKHSQKEIASLIYECFRVTGAHETILEFKDLFSVLLRGDEVQGFDTRWDEVLLSTEDTPADNVVEGLHMMWIRESDQLHTVLAFMIKT